MLASPSAAPKLTVRPSSGRLQHYVSGTLVYIFVEMLVFYVYYRYINHNGFGAGPTAFLLVVAILNAGRNSLSFFLLLVVVSAEASRVSRWFQAGADVVALDCRPTNLVDGPERGDPDPGQRHEAGQATRDRCECPRASTRFLVGSERTPTNAIVSSCLSALSALCVRRRLLDRNRRDLP